MPALQQKITLASSSFWSLAVELRNQVQRSLRRSHLRLLHASHCPSHIVHSPSQWSETINKYGQDVTRSCIASHPELNRGLQLLVLFYKSMYLYLTSLGKNPRSKPPEDSKTVDLPNDERPPWLPGSQLSSSFGVLAELFIAALRVQNVCGKRSWFWASSFELHRPLGRGRTPRTQPRGSPA